MGKKVKKTTVTTTTTEEIINSNEKTQIICILDRSGSMYSIINDSIGGFNSFIKNQKDLPDEATLTVALFDDKYEILYEDVSLKDVSDITTKEWTPRGSTSLYDAIGKTINTVKSNHIENPSNKPDKVLVCIVTDGMENTSVEYTKDMVSTLIGDCEKDGWNFIYLAANQDAMVVGSGFGISTNNTFSYTATADGVSNMSATLDSATTSFRSMSVSSDNYYTASKNLINSDNTGDISTDNLLTND